MIPDDPKRPKRRDTQDPWVRRWLSSQLPKADATRTRRVGPPQLPERAFRSAVGQDRGIPAPRGNAQGVGTPQGSVNAVGDALLSMAPVTGDVADVADVQRNLSAGKLGQAALSAGMIVLPNAVQGFGKGARKVLNRLKGTDEFEHLMNKGRFSIFTAENPGGTAMDATRNAERNTALQKELAGRGYTVVPVKGRYVDNKSGETLQENSFLVPNLGEREAKLLGRRYGQNGVITQRGYHNLDDNTFHPSRGVEEAKDVPYTELPDGRRVALDIDWDQRLPTTVNAIPVPPNANPEAMRLVDQLRGTMGGAAPPVMPRVKAVPEDKGRLMAQAYEALPEVDPEAKGAYDALTSEVDQQFQAIADAGYTIEFVDADPYKNSKELFADLKDNRTLKVLKTNDSSQHPYMSRDQNDKFRAVHDFIAHGGGGNQFGKIGEENAYRIHASTLSPQAQRALATETRGQNSWVNFGPESGKPVTERPFAQQKAALWPEGLLGDYDGMPNAGGGAGAVADAPPIGAPNILPVTQARKNWLQEVKRIDPYLPYEDMGKNVLPVPQVDIDRQLPRSGQGMATYWEAADQALKHLNSPGVRKRTETGIRYLGDQWYLTDPLAYMAMDQLGDKEGLRRFELLMKTIAATSPNSEFGKNTQRGLGLFPAMLRGVDFKGKNINKLLGSGLGNTAHNNYASMLSRITQGAPSIAATPLKVDGFAPNLMGNFTPGTNDRWMARFFGMDETDMGNPMKYLGGEHALQRWSRNMRKRGILELPDGRDATAAGQSTPWVGEAVEGGVLTQPLPAMGFIGLEVNRAADALGITKKEAYRRLWRGDLHIGGRIQPKNQKRLRGLFDIGDQW